MTVCTHEPLIAIDDQLVGNMPDLHIMDKMGRAIQSQVSKIAAQLNDVILRVIWERDHDALWDLEALHDRMVYISAPGEPDGTEYVFFDEEPMMTIFAWETHKDGKKVLLSRPYIIHPVVEKEHVGDA